MTNTAHPFTKRPHRTLLALSIPVLVSMTAEPLTALIDTAFAASLGSVSLAALGVVQRRYLAYFGYSIS